MNITSLPNIYFDNFIFQGNVVKFNSAAKTTLVALGVLALVGSVVAAFHFSAVWLPALGGVFFLSCLVEANGTTFHNRKYDEEIKTQESLLLGKDPIAVGDAHYALSQLYSNPSYTPELSAKRRISKGIEHLYAAEKGPSAESSALASLELGDIFYKYFVPKSNPLLTYFSIERWYLKACQSEACRERGLSALQELYEEFGTEMFPGSTPEILEARLIKIREGLKTPS